MSGANEVGQGGGPGTVLIQSTAVAERIVRLVRLRSGRPRNSREWPPPLTRVEPLLLLSPGAREVWPAGTHNCSRSRLGSMPMIRLLALLPPLIRRYWRV